MHMIIEEKYLKKSTYIPKIGFEIPFMIKQGL